MSKKTIMGLIATFALGLTVALVAQGPGPGFGGRRGHGPGPEMGMFGPGAIRMLGNYLDLSDAQKELIRPILEGARNETQPLREEMKQAHQDLQAAIESGDTAAVDAIAARSGELMGQLLGVGARTHIQLKQTLEPTLTPEQQEKLAKLKEFRELGKEMRESFRGPGPRSRFGPDGGE